jgi:hypothetical protein
VPRSFVAFTARRMVFLEASAYRPQKPGLARRTERATCRLGSRVCSPGWRLRLVEHLPRLDRRCTRNVLRRRRASGASWSKAPLWGERSPFDFHATRHTFVTWFGRYGVDDELVDRLLWQSPRTTRGRHYQAANLAVLARAIGTLELTLPDRPVCHTLRPLGRRNRPANCPRRLGLLGGVTKKQHKNKQLATLAQG